VHPFAPRHRRRDAAILERLRLLHEGPPAAAVPAFLALYAGFACPTEVLAQGLGLREDEARALATAAGGTVLAIPEATSAEAFTTGGKWTCLRDAVIERVRAWHGANPLLPGMELESLRSCVSDAPDARTFRWAINRLLADGVLVRAGSVVHLPGHRVALDERARAAAARIEAALQAGGLTPPDLRTLDAAGLTQRELIDLLGVLERDGRVVRVAGDLYYARDAVERGVALLVRHCTAHGGITAAVFRDLIGASRKYSIAFLDYCDRSGVTVRVGDARKLR
jgi:selenocysteine-specific elongation factor